MGEEGAAPYFIDHFSRNFLETVNYFNMIGKSPVPARVAPEKEETICLAKGTEDDIMIDVKLC